MLVWHSCTLHRDLHKRNSTWTCGNGSRRASQSSCDRNASLHSQLSLHQRIAYGNSECAQWHSWRSERIIRVGWTKQDNVVQNLSLMLIRKVVLLLSRSSWFRADTECVVLTFFLGQDSKWRCEVARCSMLLTIKVMFYDVLRRLTNFS